MWVIHNAIYVINVDPLDYYNKHLLVKRNDSKEFCPPEYRFEQLRHLVFGLMPHGRACVDHSVLAAVLCHQVLSGHYDVPSRQ